MQTTLIIYKTTNLINGKIYVGKNTNGDSEYLGSGTIILAAIEKYGKENFRREVLEICETEELLNLAEIRWIEELDARNPNVGYNILPGGEGNMKGWYMTLPPEERSRRAKKACETIGKEGLVERAKKGAETLGEKGCSDRMLKANETLGTQGRSKRQQKSRESMGPEGRSAIARKAAETLRNEGRGRNKTIDEVLGEEGRKARTKAALDSMGPEGRSARAKKAWETKRKRKD